MKFSIEKKYCIILNVMYDSEFVTVNVKGETIEELYKILMQYIKIRIV